MDRILPNDIRLIPKGGHGIVCYKCGVMITHYEVKVGTACSIDDAKTKGYVKGLCKECQKKT